MLDRFERVEVLSPARSGENSLEKFDVRQVSPFIYKSTSEETRRSYKRVVKEFFAFVSNIQPQQVEPEDVLSFRD